MTAVTEMESDVTDVPDSRRGWRLMLVAEDLGGGTGNHVAAILGELQARACDVMLVTRNVPLVRQLPSGIHVHLMRSARWFDRFPLAQVLRLIELRRIILVHRPDVVHTYFFWSIVYGRILKALGTIGVLVENREDMGFNWSRMTYRVLRLTRHLPDRVICVADAVRRVSLRREALPADRAAVVRNGVPPAPTAVDRAAARATFGFGDEHVVIGMVANLPRAVKGGSRFLDMAGAIVAAVPTARFLLVGIGTDRASLEPALLSRGLDEYVVGAGYRSDVDVCYAAMDISILTSSSEGLSITLLESMRAGLPAVVTDVGGNSEVVVDGVTGCVVPLDDPSRFVERVTRLARDGELRARMGEAARARVADTFAIPRVAERYQSIYETLLAARYDTRAVTAPSTQDSRQGR